MPPNRPKTDPNYRAGRGGKAWRETRKAILEAHGYICWMCGRPGADTVDHITPLAQGGAPLDPNNLKPAHGKRQPWGCPGNYGRRSTTVNVPPTSRQW